MSTDAASRPGSRRRWPACLLLAWAVHAAQGEPTAHGETLSAVLRLAQDSDPIYLSIRAQSESAVFRVGEARSVHYPSVGLEVSGVRANSNIPYASPPVSTETNANVALSVQETLFSRANNLAIQQAELGRDQSAVSLVEAQQDLIVRVAQAYFGVLTAMGAAQSARSSEQSIAEQLYAAKRGYAAGTLSITDTLEATARHDLAAEQLLLAQNDLERQRIALSRVAGRAGITPLPLAMPFAPPPLESTNEAEWLRKAEEASPALRRAQATWDIAKLETERARATRLPTVSARASFGRARSHYDFQAAENYPETSGTGNVENNQIALTISVPLFSGFYIQSRINESGKLEEKARCDYEAVLKDVDSSIQSALSVAILGFARLKNLETAAQSSAEAYQSTRLGFQVGTKTNIDVLNAQTQLYLTERSLIAARYAHLLAILQLRRAAGQLNDGDVTAIDGLLLAE